MSGRKKEEDKEVDYKKRMIAIVWKVGGEARLRNEKRES